MIADKLASIPNGKTKKINGVKVKSVDGLYEIDGQVFDPDEAADRIDKTPKATGFAYQKTVFMLTTPFGVKVSTHRIADRTEHTNLINRAKKRGLYVYYAGIQKLDDKYYTQYPWVVDWDSVPSSEDESKSASAIGLSCPFCGKSVTSTPGRTLHVKHKHSDQFDEYQRMYAD